MLRDIIAVFGAQGASRKQVINLGWGEGGWTPQFSNTVISGHSLKTWTTLEVDSTLNICARLHWNPRTTKVCDVFDVKLFFQLSFNRFKSLGIRHRLGKFKWCRCS